MAAQTAATVSAAIKHPYREGPESPPEGSVGRQARQDESRVATAIVMDSSGVRRKPLAGLRARGGGPED